MTTKPACSARSLLPLLLVAMLTACAWPLRPSVPLVPQAPPPPPAALTSVQPLRDWESFSNRLRDWLQSARREVERWQIR